MAQYNIVIGNDVETYTLTYELDNFNAVRVWANIMKNCGPADLRPGFNPWRGQLGNWDDKISELNKLIATINEWIPEPIDGFWNNDDPIESMNRLHVHFPEQEKIETDTAHRNQLTRYNDLIHEVESLYRNIRNKKDTVHLMICPDTGNWSNQPLADEDYNYFQLGHEPGDLMLAYPHVGKHPLEIYRSRDLTVPSNQILPQTRIASLHYLHFVSTQHSYEDFHKFYNESGIQWPYAINDPKFAVGYIRLGRLKYVNNLSKTEEEIYQIVKKCTQIVSWNIQD